MLLANFITTEQEYLAKGYAPNGEFVKLTITHARQLELMQAGYYFYCIYPID